MDVHRLAAFSTSAAHGNPAGVVICESFPSDADMQAIASDVGYSETVFAVQHAKGSYTVRYFAPMTEVDFCGHATIALGVQLGEQLGVTQRVPYRIELATNVGQVDVVINRNNGRIEATLFSAQASVLPLAGSLCTPLLDALRLTPHDLDPTFEPVVGHSGNLHPVVVVRTREILRSLAPDLIALGEMCRLQQWVTIQVVYRHTNESWSARNPFPVGGVAEDPATGSAAIALAAALRVLPNFPAPFSLVIEQGADMGRPSTLHVHVADAVGPISVTGTAVRISLSHPGAPTAWHSRTET